MNDVLRIDNPRDEFEALLGNDFLQCVLTPVDFPAGMTVEDFWKRSERGVFMLLSASEKQPRFAGASVHVTILHDGTIRNASAAILKKALVAVQQVLTAPQSSETN